MTVNNKQIINKKPFILPANMLNNPIDDVLVLLEPLSCVITEIPIKSMSEGFKPDTRPPRPLPCQRGFPVPVD